MLLSRVGFEVEEVVRVVRACAALATISAGVTVTSQGAVGEHVGFRDLLVERVPAGAPNVRHVLVLPRAECPLGELELLVASNTVGDGGGWGR